MVKNRSSTKKNMPSTRKKTKTVPQKTTRAPLAINTKTRNQAPKVRSSASGTVISHREILSDSVRVEPNYSVSSVISVQPAISTYSHGSPLGSWLPKIAAEYDNYCFEQLKIHFTTSASSLQKGTIFMAFDPNPDGQPPQTFTDLRNMAYAVTGPARENLTLDISNNVSTKKLLTRKKGVASYPNYDAGRIFLGSTLGDSTSVGYFEVEYVVRLMNPQTSPDTDVLASSSIPPACVYTDEGSAPLGLTTFGTSHAQRNALAYTDYLFRRDPYGDSTLLVMNSPSTVFAANGSAVIQGITYSWVAGRKKAQFTFRYPGRYRLRATINGDWQDYCTFGASIVKGSVGSDALDAAQDYALTSFSGDPVSIPVVPGSVRGFSAPSIGACDMGLILEQTFVVLDTVTPYALAIGVRNNTDIAENGTAGYYQDAAKCGISVLKLEYLGPLPTT